MGKELFHWQGIHWHCSVTFETRIAVREINVLLIGASPTNTPTQSPMLRVKKLTEFAIVPARGSACAAGYDLSRCVSVFSNCHTQHTYTNLPPSFPPHSIPITASAYAGVVPARGKAMLKTDIAIAVPLGTYGRVAPRSGLALKHGIDVGAGVIDEDYRGNVGVILFNHSDVDFLVAAGDRVAQLILEKIETPEVEVVEDLSETVRGGGGFGSTGVAGVDVTKKARVE